MSKKRVFDRREQVRIDDLFDGRTIDEVILDLRNMLHNYEQEIFIYDKDMRFEIEYDYDGGTHLYVRVDRWETDQEYKKRLAREQVAKDKAKRAREAKKAKALAMAVSSEEEERALFEKLKAKFGE